MHSNDPKLLASAEPVGEASLMPESPLIDFKPIKEINGPTGPEPTRYGDWERKGRCIDF